jgi:hypothetical protein
MAGDKVTAVAPARRHGALEIDRGPDLHRAQVGQRKRLLQQIEGEPRSLDAGHRQAAAVQREAVAEAHLRREFRRLQGQPVTAGMRLQSDHASRGFDETGEHVSKQLRPGGDVQFFPRNRRWLSPKSAEDSRSLKNLFTNYNKIVNFELHPYPRAPISLFTLHSNL